MRHSGTPVAIVLALGIDSIFSVYESAALTLTTLEPGDVVRITYVTRGDQPQARRLVKVTAADRPR